MSLLGIAESTPYSILPTTSDIISDKTSEIAELATESSSNFRTALQGWIVDLFRIATAFFLMAGVWLAYLEIAEFLVSITRQLLGRNRPLGEKPRDRAPVIVDDKIDSAATSGKSGDETEVPARRVPDIRDGDQCRPDQLYLGAEGPRHLSPRKCPTKYKHEMNVTIGDQMRGAQGGNTHAGDRIRLCDTRFAKYRSYNEENQFREMGCRVLGFLIPFGDITIRVCVKNTSNGKFYGQLTQTLNLR